MSNNQNPTKKPLLVGIITNNESLQEFFFTLARIRTGIKNPVAYIADIVDNDGNERGIFVQVFDGEEESN